MTDRQSSGLRQAASTVFVFTTVLPLLIFTWTLYRLDVVHSFEAQVGLILALIVALLGFAIFRSMMARLSDVIHALGTVAARHEAVREKPAVTAAPVSSSSGRPSRAGAAQRREASVPGLGTIRELRDMTSTMAAVWQREATPYIGRQVLVSVLNSERPISGTLVKVTGDGVLLEQGDDQIAVGYRRFAGIELDAS